MCLYENEIMQQDMENIEKNTSIPFEKLKDKSILVTGATGMLAYYFVCSLMFMNEKRDYNIHVIALARNKEKAIKQFKCFEGNGQFELIFQDVCEDIQYKNNVDYILHAAGNSSPFHIKNKPVDIIKTNTVGTIKVLELARQQKNCLKNIVYTSTREIYGKVENEKLIHEDCMGILDPLDSRSCYPESKRIAEQLFKSYSVQYSLPFNITRIAHSYGPGMQTENDGRVMSDFVSDVIDNRNIILKSSGKARRAFCYVNDAVSALLMVMLKGVNGEAYNIANELEDYEIRDVAEMMVKSFPEKNIHVDYQIQQNDGGYCNYKRVALSTKKLEELGWIPKVNLKEGILKTINSFG